MLWTLAANDKTITTKVIVLATVASIALTTANIFVMFPPLLLHLHLLLELLLAAATAMTNKNLIVSPFTFDWS